MDIHSSYKSNNPMQTGHNQTLSVQSWKNPKSNQSATDRISSDLNRAAAGGVGTYNINNVENAFSLKQAATASPVKDPYAFKDVLDIINPLHHIPIVGSLYRSVTGDEIKPASQIIGGSLFGGPIGAVTATINAISEMQTGSDINDRAMSMVGFSGVQKPLNPDVIYRQYQEDEDSRTVNWSGNSNNILSYKQHSYTDYHPVTTLSLTAMPPRTLIDA